MENISSPSSIKEEHCSPSGRFQNAAAGVVGMPPEVGARQRPRERERERQRESDRERCAGRRRSTVTGGCGGSGCSGERESGIPEALARGGRRVREF